MAFSFEFWSESCCVLFQVRLFVMWVSLVGDGKIRAWRPLDPSLAPWRRKLIWVTFKDKVLTVQWTRFVSVTKKTFAKLFVRKLLLFLLRLVRNTQMRSVNTTHNLWTLTFWRRNYFFNFSTPVYKMWITQERNTLELWNKLHFEGGKKNGEYIPCLKYSVPIFVE